MDSDHIGGAMKLLADPEVGLCKIWGSADATKDTKTYHDLLYAIQDAYERREVEYSCNLNISVGRGLDFGRIRADIVHPNIRYAGVGPNRGARGVGSVSSNGMSAVIRLHLDGVACVLLAGDADGKAVRTMLTEGRELKANVLVFPHHGGLVNGDNPEEIGRVLSAAVDPKVIVFSMGRSRFNNPAPEVLRGARAGAPRAHIACTQLSKMCHKGVIEARTETSEHRWPSRGAANGLCCSGTVKLTVVDGAVNFDPSIKLHREFVTLHVEQPQCAGR
jgi:competence protein ComEC